MQVRVNQSSGIRGLFSAVLFSVSAFSFPPKFSQACVSLGGSYFELLNSLLWKNASSFMQFAYVSPASVGLFSFIIAHSLQSVPVKPNRPRLLASPRDADERVGGRPERWRVHSVHHLGVSRIVKGLFLIWPVDCKILV